MDIYVKNIIHLKEAAREFEICEFIEGTSIQGFDLEGIFMAHLNLVGYMNLSEIFIPWKVEGDGSPKTIINTNVKKLKHSKTKE